MNSKSSRVQLHSLGDGPPHVEALIAAMCRTCPTLSPRERQVVAYIANGFTHDQTACRVGLSKHTVDTYVKRVRAKLNVGNKAELARMAFNGLSAFG